MDALCFFCILMYYFTVIILYIVQIIIKKNTTGEIAHAIKKTIIQNVTTTNACNIIFDY